MAQQTIDLGAAPNDGTGDDLRTAGDKINDNFTELYTDKAPLASPTFTDTPAAPTAAPGTNTTQLANTAFVVAAITALINSAPGALDTLDELAAALGDDANFAATIAASLAGKQPLDSDLTAIAGLSPSNDDIIQRKAGAWVNRTMAQLWPDVVGGFVLAQSGVQASHTGDTAEHTFATVALPAGALGANGQLEVEAMFSHTSSGNSKTSRVKLGSTVIAGLAVTTSGSANVRNRVSNRNAQNSQVFMAPGLSTHFGITSVAISTSAVDTASAQNITFTGQLTNSGETISLESYRILLFPKA